MTSTRSQVTELTEPIDDPEQLLRRHSTMADLRPQDTPNPEEAHAEQSEEATGDPGNAATNTATDAEATRVPVNPREPVPHRDRQLRRSVPTRYEKHSNEGSMQERHCTWSRTICG